MTGWFVYEPLTVRSGATFHIRVSVDLLPIRELKVFFINLLRHNMSLQVLHIEILLAFALRADKILDLVIIHLVADVLLNTGEAVRMHALKQHQFFLIFNLLVADTARKFLRKVLVVFYRVELQICCVRVSIPFLSTQNANFAFQYARSLSNEGMNPAIGIIVQIVHCFLQ